MRTTEPCRHCGYSIPSTASTCSGCGRWHEAHDVGDPERAPRRSHLLHAARRVRYACLLSVWVALAFGLSSLSRAVVGLEDVADDVDEDVPARLTTLTERLGIATLVAIGVTMVLTGLWASHCRRNLRKLGLDEPRWTAWSLAGWFVPGRVSMADKVLVDATWRESSPTVAALQGAGWSRQPVSRVVLRWWSLWLWVPAVAVLVVLLIGPGLDDDSVGQELGFAGIAAAALLVAAARALYDVVGIVTTAHAHRAEAVLRRRRTQSSLDGSSDGAASSRSSASSAEVATA